MEEREKNAHKNTRVKPFGSTGGNANGYSAPQEKHHGFLGGLFGGHKHSAPHEATAPPVRTPTPVISPAASSRNSIIESLDPQLKQDLIEMGITEEQMAQNIDFIQSFVAAQKKQEESKTV